MHLLQSHCTLGLRYPKHSGRRLTGSRLLDGFDTDCKINQFVSSGHTVALRAPKERLPSGVPKEEFGRMIFEKKSSVGDRGARQAEPPRATRIQPEPMRKVVLIAFFGLFFGFTPAPTEPNSQKCEFSRLKCKKAKKTTKTDFCVRKKKIEFSRPT